MPTVLRAMNYENIYLPGKFAGEFMINSLEPKAWTDGKKGGYDSPKTFKNVTR